MKIVRVYSGDDGESHFEDIEIPLTDRGAVGRISALEAATGVVFRENDGDYLLDFHCAPRRQYVINLDSSIEIEVGDGSKRVLRPGDVLLAEDTTGHGHISRSIENKPRRSIFVTLDQAVDPAELGRQITHLLRDATPRVKENETHAR